MPHEARPHEARPHEASARPLSLRALKRSARQLQRSTSLSHCEALDHVAQQHGYASWSLLAVKARLSQPPAAATPFPWNVGGVFRRLRPGEVLLLGSRPNQGKTARAVALLTRALRQGLPCWFFSLANDPTRLGPLFTACGQPYPNPSPLFNFLHSDALCASSIVERIRGLVAPRSLIVIDHLQLLDQRRSSPELQQQLNELRAFARETGCIFLLLSQLRSELDTQQRAPRPADIRLPNALDLASFDRLSLLHAGSERWHATG